MGRCQAEGKGDHGTDYECCDDNDGVVIFIYFHADSPIILFVYFASLRPFLSFWA
jgi:hypothetical protein